MFNAAGSVGSSMTGKKLPGEESTVIDSPSIAMASGQVDPKKMGAPVCSPSGAGFKMPKNGNLLKNAGNTTELPALGQQVKIYIFNRRIFEVSLYNVFRRTTKLRMKYINFITKLFSSSERLLEKLVNSMPRVYNK